MAHVLGADDARKVGSARAAVDGEEREGRRLASDAGDGADDLRRCGWSACGSDRSRERTRKGRTVAFGSGMACVSSFPLTLRTCGQRERLVSSTSCVRSRRNWTHPSLARDLSDESGVDLAAAREGAGPWCELCAWALGREGLSGNDERGHVELRAGGAGGKPRMMSAMSFSSWLSLSTPPSTRQDSMFAGESSLVVLQEWVLQSATCAALSSSTSDPLPRLISCSRGGRRSPSADCLARHRSATGTFARSARARQAPGAPDPQELPRLHRRPPCWYVQLPKTSCTVAVRTTRSRGSCALRRLCARRGAWQAAGQRDHGADLLFLPVYSAVRRQLGLPPLQVTHSHRNGRVHTRTTGCRAASERLVGEADRFLCLRFLRLGLLASSSTLKLGRDCPCTAALATLEVPTWESRSRTSAPVYASSALRTGPALSLPARRRSPTPCTSTMLAASARPSHERAIHREMLHFAAWPSERSRGRDTVGAGSRASPRGSADRCSCARQVCVW